MKKRSSKSSKRSLGALRTLSIRGTRQPKLSDEFVVVRTGPSRVSKSSPKSSEEAQILIERVGRALKNPGIHKNIVFKRGIDGLFAYSADLEDPKKIVRRSSNGKKVRGRLVQGRFRAG